MKVYIITEGNSNVGFGHISRCTSLYCAFLERNIKPYFIINGDEIIENFLEISEFSVFNWLKDKKELFTLINGVDVAIIDSYSYSTLLAEKISQSVKLPIFIDDYNRINYPRGIVINGSIHAKNLNYPNNPRIYYLLGAEYVMLKKTFWDYCNRNFNKKISTIMITLGINDINNITPKLIEFLNKNLPDLKMKVIIGKYYQHINEIEKIESKNLDLIYFPDTNEMKNIMLKSDIAITAGGQTSYELISLDVLPIIIAVADNQIESAEYLNKLGIAFYAGWWENRNLLNKILDFIQYLRNSDIRREMIRKSKEFIKPDGSRKIIDVIMNRFK